MKNIISIIICLLFSANTVEAQVVTINVDPVEGICNAQLADALEKARLMKNKPVVINLGQGKYYFSRSESTKELYYISNTTSEKEKPEPVKHIALLLKGFKNVVLDGNGSTLIMTGEMTSLVVDECENITFRNLIFDYLYPTQTEITVMEEGDNYLTAQVHPTSQYRIDNGKLEWYGDGWSFSEGISQAYDFGKGTTWRSWSPMSNLIRTTETEKNVLRMEYAEKPEAGIGLVYQMRDAVRDEVCGFIHKSSNVKFENVKFYYLGNFGVVGQYSENISFENTIFAPEPGSGRTNAGFADFIQISGCKGLIEIKNSHFSGAHDDPINIHGTHLQVVDFIDSHKIKVRFMHPQSYGFDAFFKDDEIEFIDSRSLLATGKARIVHAEKINPREIILTVNEKIPQSVLIHKDLVVENTTWTPEVNIIGNHFSRVPTRGILVTTRRKVLIENNTFYGMQMSGILIADDALSWYESGMVKDVTIRNNIFVECGSPVIFIEPENKVHEGPVHQNIKIENNIFKLKGSGDVAVQAKSVGNLNVIGNIFIINKKAENDIEQFVNIKDCEHVLIEENKLEKQ